MPRTREEIKKGNRFSAAVLPYVLHSFLKHLISVTPQRSMGGEKKCTELNRAWRISTSAVPCWVTPLSCGAEQFLFNVTALLLSLQCCNSSRKPSEFRDRDA